MLRNTEFKTQSVQSLHEMKIFFAFLKYLRASHTITERGAEKQTLSQLERYAKTCLIVLV